jgi:hypothetical protein
MRERNILNIPKELNVYVEPILFMVNGEVLKSKNLSTASETEILRMFFEKMEKNTFPQSSTSLAKTHSEESIFLCSCTNLGGLDEI